MGHIGVSLFLTFSRSAWIGLTAYGWMLAAFGLAFWRGRRSAGAYPIFGAWVGYQVTLLVNFSAIAVGGQGPCGP